MPVLSRRTSLLLLPVMLLAGCNAAPGILSVPAEYSLSRSDVLLVVPFRDPAMPYFQSQTGSELANTITAYLEQATGKTTIISGTTLRASIRDLDYTEHSLAEAAREIGATKILEGAILELETNAPKSPDLVRGKLTVRFSIRSAEDAGKALFEKQATYYFPDERNWQRITTQDMPPREVLGRLIALAGSRIAQTFHKHERLKGELEL